MRSEKIILLRHLVAFLAISSSAPCAQALLKFSPIKDITLGTEVTIDWTGQPSLGNVQQAVVLMKDGNALLTLCEGQITGSGQCSFELRPEHQVLGDGYQLAMQGKDGLALDYSGEFSIQAAEIKAEEASSGDEEAQKDEDEVEIEEESKEDEEEEDEDKEEHGEVDDDDERAGKESTGHEGEDHDNHDDNHDDENHEEDSNKAGDDDGDDEEEEGKRKKDRKHKHTHHSAQKSDEFDEHSTEDQDHHHKQQEKKQHSKQHKQQQKDDKYYRQQADKQLKKILQKHKQQLQQWFTVQSTLSPKQRAKEAERLLEKNRRRRQMMLVATRQKYLRLRQEALGIQMSISSVLDQIVPASAQAAELPEVNKNIGIQPVLGNDAHVELMPEQPIVEAAVAGGIDEIDIELADELNHHPLEKKDTNDMRSNKQDDERHKKDEKKKRRLEERAEEKKDKDNTEPSVWDKMWGGIAAFGKDVGAIVADGFAKVKQAVVGGGAETPEGEL
ncbi:hypothetical protein BGZ95_003775 [Linnemannia exigua]|uniref:Uncharacterized protein n=1 Tax=Linnemannia exigua TaxID=604196 RepID=A0AAD4D3U0_9FUNG|nr:hypothetical protein BGZ95_003775 [Linnemannia exigua]